MGERVFALWKTKHTRKASLSLPPPLHQPHLATEKPARQPGPHIAWSHIKPSSLAAVNMAAGEKMAVEPVPLSRRPVLGRKQRARRSFNMSELLPSTFPLMHTDAHFKPCSHSAPVTPPTLTESPTRPSTTSSAVAPFSQLHLCGSPSTSPCFR